MVIKSVWIATVDRISGAVERKTCAVAGIRFLCESQASLRSPLVEFWYLSSYSVPFFSPFPSVLLFSFCQLFFALLIYALKGILIEKEILDKPRKVTGFHYCLSQPKKRNNPQLAGLSKRTLKLLGYDEE